MSEEVEQIEKGNSEDLPMKNQSEKKQLQELRQEMKALQSGETLALAERDALQINKKNREALDEYNHTVAAYEQRLRERQSRLPIDYNTLPFRKTLEDVGGSELVEYIKQNFSWLRLIVLLYGGITDQGMATYAMQYDEIAAVIQLDDPSRLFHIDRLREKNYWKKNWDSSDDIVYTLAVYLDTECGKLAKQAANFVPEFTPHAIFNDSPLTSLILQALRQKQHPSVLKDRLWREWHTSSHKMRRVHALLALLLLDTQPAIDTLIHSYGMPATSTLAELVINQLRLRKHTLANALILLGKRAEIGQSLKPLQDVLEGDQWGDLIELFFRTFSSVMPFPVKYDDILLSSAATIPLINAEIWLYWLSGFNGDDSIYSFEVILDTIGKKIKSNTALLNIQHAHNRKYDTFTHWHSIAIPPLYSGVADIVGEALTIAHQSNSELLKSLFYIGTMKYIGVNYEDFPDLKKDALAATLLIPFEFQKEVVDELDSELSHLPVYEAINIIIERVWSIKDHVIKARALWRVAQYRPNWKNLNLWDLAIEAAEQVDDPLHRSCAIERLLKFIPSRQLERLKDEAVAAAKDIKDPNNRARALARLASYESHERRFSLLCEALAAIEQIGSENLRINTLQLIYPYLAEYHQLVQMSDKIINNLKSDWYRNKGRNLLSLKLLSLHDQLHEAAKLTPVILAAFIDEVVALKPQQTEREDLWSQLLDHAKREHALSALLKIASANDVNGLYLSTQASEVIQSLLRLKEIAAIHILLPHLRGIDPSLLPLLNNWVSKRPDDMLWAYAGLLLAESGQVDFNTIPCLLELIKNGSDFGRYRASIILHGPDIRLEKKNRSLRTSRLGVQSLFLLVEAFRQSYSEKTEQLAEVLWMTFFNIIHDDPVLLEQLIERAETEERIEDGVSRLLETISYCDANCLNEFVKQFEEGSEKTQGFLLCSWINLSLDYFKSNVAIEQKQRMEEAISKLSKSTFERYIVIPERLETIPKLLVLEGERIEKNEVTLQQAIPVLNQKLSALSLRLPSTSIEEFQKHAYYHPYEDPLIALEAAHKICENGISLELLFAWLAASLREDLNDTTSFYRLTSTLLELAGATTHFSPAAIYTLIEKNMMEHLLIEAMMQHRSPSGRAGAAALLAYLRQTSEAFDDALLSGLKDDAEVQTAIVHMARELRYPNEKMILRMLNRLEDEDASVVYTISALLATIARNDISSYSIRQMIAASLSKAIQRNDSSRPVYLLRKAGSGVFIRNVGRLDHQLYKAIIDIIGIM